MPNMMINRRPFVMLLLVFMSGCLSAAEKDEAWRTLSARSQNLHRQLLLMGPDTAPDPSMHEDALKGIETALNSLVKLGELHSKKIRLKAPKEIGDELTQKLFASVEPLSELYGVFVASEMCGLGARLYFILIKTDEEVELHLRLPEKELKKFESALVKLGVVAETKAQQDAAGQSATAE